MDLDKTTCVVCKSKITDEKEYICTECYEKSLKGLENNELYQQIKKIDNSDWLMGLIIMFALFGMKGE